MDDDTRATVKRDALPIESRRLDDLQSDRWWAPDPPKDVPLTQAAFDAAITRIVHAVYLCMVMLLLGLFAAIWFTT